MKTFVMKPRINKANGQINFSLPKKKIPKSLADDIKNFKCEQIRITLEDFK